MKTQKKKKPTVTFSCEGRITAVGNQGIIFKLDDGSRPRTLRKEDLAGISSDLLDVGRHLRITSTIEFVPDPSPMTQQDLRRLAKKLGIPEDRVGKI